MTVLDSSAVLALVHDEPGADVLLAGLPGAASLAEVVRRLVDAEVDAGRLRELPAAAGCASNP